MDIGAWGCHRNYLRPSTQDMNCLLFTRLIAIFWWLCRPVSSFLLQVSSALPSHHIQPIFPLGLAVNLDPLPSLLSSYNIFTCFYLYCIFNTPRPQQPIIDLSRDRGSGPLGEDWGMIWLMRYILEHAGWWSWILNSLASIWPRRTISNWISPLQFSINGEPTRTPVRTTHSNSYDTSALHDTHWDTFENLGLLRAPKMCHQSDKQDVSTLRGRTCGFNAWPVPRRQILQHHSSLDQRFTCFQTNEWRMLEHPLWRELVRTLPGQGSGSHSQENIHRKESPANPTHSRHRPQPILQRGVEPTRHSFLGHDDPKSEGVWMGDPTRQESWAAHEHFYDGARVGGLDGVDGCLLGLLQWISGARGRVQNETWQWRWRV